MSSNVVNQVAYLRTTREFPEEIHQLAVEINKAYVDTADAVNSRTISIFPTTRPAINGENWFITANRRQQGFRQIYPFTAAGNITHGINVANIYGFTKIYGTFTDGTNWYPLPYVDVIAANNQVSIYVNNTNIVITQGAGAPPAITKGLVVLEWISLP